MIILSTLVICATLIIISDEICSRLDKVNASLIGLDTRLRELRSR